MNYEEFKAGVDAKIDNENDRFDAKTSASILLQFTLEYHAATEVRRKAVLEALLEAESKGDDILEGFIPGGSWRMKYPLSARKAVLAMWAVPRT